MNNQGGVQAQKSRFPSLRYRDFRVLWFGMLFASGTLAFQYYAQMWLIYSITDSALTLGILGVIRGAATFLFGLYGGSLADRMDRRMLLIVFSFYPTITALLFYGCASQEPVKPLGAEEYYSRPCFLISFTLNRVLLLK